MARALARASLEKRVWVVVQMSVWWFLVNRDLQFHERGYS